MQVSKITITGDFKNCKIKVEGIPEFEWKSYTTSNEKILFLRAFLEHSVSEVTYEPLTEDFLEAIKRAVAVETK